VSQTFIERIQEAVRGGFHAIKLLIVFSLSKAHDGINHNILLGAPNSYDIIGKSHFG
jgi:hypothetical protein